MKITQDFSPVLFLNWRRPIFLDDKNNLSLEELFNLEKKTFLFNKHFLRLHGKNRFQVIEDHSLSRALAVALNNGFKWLAVVSPGTLLKGDFFRVVESLCAKESEDVALFAHLLDRGERGFGFHKQFFVVNTSAWHSWGKPSLRPPMAGPAESQEILRSSENIHDDYTPHWLKAGKTRKMTGRGVLGWSWIQAAMSEGQVVRNIPVEVRKEKIYLYPEENPRQVLSLLTYPWKFSTEEFRLNLNDSLKEVLDLLVREHPNAGARVFPLNTESYSDVEVSVSNGPIDEFYSVASGFKDLFILHHNGFHPGTKIHYFDFNAQALAFKQMMFETWDGKDFPRWYIHQLDNFSGSLVGARMVVSRDEVQTLWDRELVRWGGGEKFYQTFQKVRALPKNFLQLNVVESPEAIADQIRISPNGIKAIWISNCFDYTPTIFTSGWDVEGLAERGYRFLFSLIHASKNSKLLIYGEDVTRGVKYLESGNEIENSFY